MTRTSALSIALTAITLLSGCERSDNPAHDNASSSAGTDTPTRFDRPTDVLSKSGIQMVYLPSGEFKMGTTRGNPDEKPVHSVRVSGFLIDKFEVTHEMFVKAQLPNPSHWQENPKNPVERVRWSDARLYCNERSLLEGLKPCYDESAVDWKCDYSASGYRLPTEAEWEYAARAGTSGPYDFGEERKLRQFAWFADNAGAKTHAVGQKKPNRWGIFDMYGNVSEWCEDVYSPTYYTKSPAKDPIGPPSPGDDEKRVLRGGSWKASAAMCRVTFRKGERTGTSDACFYTDFCGFRCVRRATPDELKQLVAQRNAQ